MDGKLLLIILDGVPWRNWRRLFGNLEGWVASGEAQMWRMRSVWVRISSADQGECTRLVEAGWLPSPSPSSGRQARCGRIGRGAKLPPQVGQTLCSTSSAQCAQ